MERKLSRNKCLAEFYVTFNSLGFIEEEVVKDNIPISDIKEPPPAPLPRDMIELEVK
jgi:hypothetical protein